MWGRGEYGRLGLGDRSGSSKLRATLVQFREPDIRIVQVGADRHRVMQPDIARACPVLSTNLSLFLSARFSTRLLCKDTKVTRAIARMPTL